MGFTVIKVYSSHNKGTLTLWDLQYPFKNNVWSGLISLIISGSSAD